MDVEEPSAAAIISQAQNLPQQQGMRTTELAAVACLKGEIILQLGKDLSQRVAWQTVRERVRSQLHAAADDPDLAEVFEFLISNGVGSNNYIDNLLEWTGVMVDSNLRQLRLHAFGVMNKMCEEAVWSRIAVLKRAYKKKPNKGFCGSPEPAWTTFSWAQLRKLEELLRFFHGSCTPITDKMASKDRIKLVGNIDVVAADAFFNAKDSKLRHGETKMGEILLAATRRYLTPLGLDFMAQNNIQNEEELKVQLVRNPTPIGYNFIGRAPCILFATDAHAEATTAQATLTAPQRSGPVVIQRDERTGEPMNTQVEFPSPGKQDVSDEKVPWRQWKTTIGEQLGVATAQKAMAVVCLQSLHVNYPVDKEPIEVWKSSSTQGHYVLATREVKHNEIMLPPCVPKDYKVLENSVHPYKVQIQVSLAPPCDPSCQTSIPEKTVAYYLNPEFTAPKAKKAKAAVVEKDAKAADGVAKGSDDVAVANEEGPTPVEDEWEWGPLGEETMHPFWVVRRLTQKQLVRENEKADAKSGRRALRFNCELTQHIMTNATIGAMKTSSLNATMKLQVPFLTNKIDLEENEELILEIMEQAPREPKKRGWRDADRDEVIALQAKRKKQRETTQEK
jgi:hypothetical protein